MATLKAKEDYRNFIIECIQLYRQLPALWDTKSDVYGNRKEKNRAYEILLAKYKEKFTEATKEDLKKKFNSLRTNYRKELKRLQHSKTRTFDGSGDISNLASGLWYFSEINFLNDQEILTPRASSSFPLKTEQPDIEEKEGNIVMVDGFMQMPTSSAREQVDSKAIHHHNSPTGKVLREDCERFCEGSQHYHRRAVPKVSNSKPLSDSDDEYFHLAKVWAKELSKMDPQQQIFAKKGIHDIIFEGQLETLHRDSIQINGVPYGMSIQYAPSSGSDSS